MGNKAGALLAKAPSASVVPASRPRAAVPIWTNPTVSVALSGLPFTDTRMPALELRGTLRDAVGLDALPTGGYACIIIPVEPRSQPRN